MFQYQEAIINDAELSLNIIDFDAEGRPIYADAENWDEWTEEEMEEYDRLLIERAEEIRMYHDGY